MDEMKGVLGATCNLQVQKREYDEGGDVYKSLDTIVTERGYYNPPSYKSGGDNVLPITGRLGRGRAIVTSQLDPMENSLDAMIIKPQSYKSRGGNGLSKTGRAVVNSNLDPMSNSLDAIIKSGKESRQENGGVRGGGGPFDRKKRFREEFEGKASRDEEDDSTNDKDRGKRRRFFGKLTPYRAVTFLSEKLMVIEVKSGMKVEFTEENTPQKWRCVVSCGNLQGIADSSRKVVARELASLEFLKLLKEAYPDGKIPEYELPPEIFLDPKVYKAIEKARQETDTDVTFEMCMENKFGGLEGGRLPFFKSIYYMNGSEFFGRSTEKNFAQLKAAYKVYEAMTGEKYPETKYFTGSDCDPNVEYDFSESEVHSFAMGSAGMVTDEKKD